ncbi:hypothetical protein [Streptomyces sp. EMB26]
MSITAGQLAASGVATLLAETLRDGLGPAVPFVLGAVLSRVPSPAAPAPP